MTSAAPGLYLHLPFCSAICPYCDFAVTTGGAERRRRFGQALAREMDLIEEEWDGIDTVYLGGGTPSYLAVESLEALFACIAGRFRLAPDTRWFLEANPEDASSANLEAWRRLGVATLSLGVQSFDAERLSFLGRRHSSREARKAVERALDAGFATVSVDLIYGLPGRPRESWRRDLETAIELGADHVSCYQLTFHRGTTFGRDLARGRLVEPSDDERAELFFTTHETLAAAGYDGYEVSNFARRPEHRSRHNQKYWSQAPYLGLGPSAHSYDGAERRWWNERRLAAWQRRVESGERPVAAGEELTLEERALERIMLGLRTTAGVDLEDLDRELGTDLAAANRRLLEEWSAAGLVRLESGHVAPTLRGLAVADRLASSLEITRAVGA